MYVGSYGPFYIILARVRCISYKIHSENTYEKETQGKGLTKETRQIQERYRKQREGRKESTNKSDQYIKKTTRGET